MNKTLSLILLFIPAWTGVTAAEVTPALAGKAALHFIALQSASAPEAAAFTFSVKEILTATAEGIPVYHVVNLLPQGWALISGDDRVPPVLAYSFKGSYSLSNPPPQCAAWMKQYEGQILHAIREQRPSLLSQWSFLPLPSSLFTPSSKGVEPLITSEWNQNFPYNAMCPEDPAGPGGHAYAGCVPTCMGQVMYYFRWPWTGTGSYSYLDSTYGVQTAVFDTTTYDWNRMTDVAEGENPAIALLLYHLGVSCDLVYGPDGSGMYNHKAAYSLKTYFKYDPKTQYVFRDSTTMNWDSILISHLDRKIPMYYAGWSVPNVMGHAFVCDGYQGDITDTVHYFHFNFGWGGQNDGYFRTDDLTVGGNNFNLAQEVIINCYPDTAAYTYPLYCSGDTKIRYQAGTFEDGSGPVKDYLPGSSCTWQIDPQTDTDSVTSITLTFGRCSLDPSDLVTVYDGPDETFPLLASLSGDTVPPPFQSAGNKMFVRFTSDQNLEGNGFFAGFSSELPVWCSGTTELVADTAEFDDGSLRFNYHDGQLCKWKVSTASGGPLTLNFRSFDTEEDHDVLKIYDFSNSTLVAQISGHYDPDTLPAPVTIEGGTAFLVFNTNGSVTAQGWEIYYPKSTQSVGEETDPGRLMISPNPATECFTLSFSGKETETGVLEILTSEGKEILKRSVVITSGPNQITVDTETLKPGLYLVRVRTAEKMMMEKVVVW